MTTADQHKEVLKELKEIKAMYKALDDRLRIVEAANLAEAAYRAALKQVRVDDKEKLEEQTSKAWLRILKEVYPILVILTAILYFYASTHGIKING
jgi:hypothetical protein